jgi:hypothetical protein
MIQRAVPAQTGPSFETPLMRLLRMRAEQNPNATAEDSFV